MRDRKVAKRYATALFSLALELGKVEEIDAQCLTLEAIFGDVELRRYYSQPRISIGKKRSFLESAFKGKVHPAVYRLLEILLDKGRIGLADIVFDYYDILTDRHRGIEEVRIVTAVEVDDAYVSRLVKKLRRFSEYPDIRVKREVDSRLIGGAMVYLGRHTVIDGSIISRMRAMHEHLLLYRR